jgi:hypothetical protein
LRDLERRGRQEPKVPETEVGTAAYVTTALGIGLIIAAVLIMITAQTAAAGFPFVLGAAACLGIGISRFARHRSSIPAAPDGERELLSAIRENGGSITPAEAAMETSLTVREADRMLSELAGEGHLLVGSRSGALFYRLPGREDPALEWTDRP